MQLLRKDVNENITYCLLLITNVLLRHCHVLIEIVLTILIFMVKSTLSPY